MQDESLHSHNIVWYDHVNCSGCDMSSHHSERYGDWGEGVVEEWNTRAIPFELQNRLDWLKLHPADHPETEDCLREIHDLLYEKKKKRKKRKKK